MQTKIKWKSDTKPKMTVHEKDGVVYLGFASIEDIPGIRHGFSTRLGGVSEGIWSSMNLSYSRGDDPANVLENYTRISHAIGFEPEMVVCSDQTHTTNVAEATALQCGNGVVREKTWHDIDGMVTNESGVVLCTTFADCVPLYFVDPVHRAIGLSHSGWRGTVGEIGRVTIEKMTALYGTDPKDVIAAIGPSICQDCYEVDDVVIDRIREGFPKEEWEEIFYPTLPGKYQLNLWAACRYTMLRAGILPEHITLPNVCTCCNHELLFSHRASKGKRGNLNAFLMLE